MPINEISREIRTDSAYDPKHFINGIYLRGEITGTCNGFFYKISPWISRSGDTYTFELYESQEDADRHEPFIECGYYGYDPEFPMIKLFSRFARKEVCRAVNKPVIDRVHEDLGHFLDSGVEAYGYMQRAFEALKEFHSSGYLEGIVAEARAKLDAEKEVHNAKRAAYARVRT